MRELFEVLKECHLQVKKQKCFLFCTQVKYVGHILHEGQRFLAPGKVAAMREWSEDMIRTPKRTKSFLCICNWYSIYIPNYASLAAPLMDSLAGKHKYDPHKRTSKVGAHKETISLTDLMREKLGKIRTPSVRPAGSIYPVTKAGSPSIRMRRTTALALSWNRRTTRETGVPVPFSVENSRAASNTTPTEMSCGIWAREHG